MTTATISAFENTLQKTNIWLKDILTELNWEGSDHERAFHALRVVLHALRDRLTVEEASDFAAQLPMLVRGFYYEGWNPSKTPVATHKRDEFLAPIAASFANDITADAEEITRAVFKVITEHVSAGEVNDMKGALPKKIRELWD